MANVVVFHHALGLTSGVERFADELRAANHTVHVPDLFDGRTFSTIEAGVAHAESVGFEKLIARGTAFVDDLPRALVYVGFSLGVLPAQHLAQTRPGAAGALLFFSCVPASHFGDWPGSVPGQIHAMEEDPIFVEDGDLAAAQELSTAFDSVELFLYPGDQHIFTEPDSPSYDPEATALAMERVLAFLS